MAPFGKIISYPGNFRAQRAQVVAGMNGLDVPLEPDFQMGVTNRNPAFLAKWPMAKVPVLECADGFCLAESAAIAAYLAASGPLAPQLLGDKPPVRAKIAEWACFADAEIGAHVGIYAGMAVFKYMAFDEGQLATAVSNLERSLKRLEVGLQAGNGKFLVGDKLTLADVMVAGPMLFAAGFCFDKKMRELVPGAAKYIEGLAGMEEFKKVWGDVKMVETRVKP